MGGKTLPRTSSLQVLLLNVTV